MNLNAIIYGPYDDFVAWNLEIIFSYLREQEDLNPLLFHPKLASSSL